MNIDCPSWVDHTRAQDLQTALLLTYITLAWMTVEGAASLLLGWASKSLLLEAFGIDSIVELFVAALALIPFLIKEGREAIRGQCDCC